jgi:ATP-binding cassette subfamily F protein 3
MERSPADFSGGYQVRLNLAKVLVSEPDLLLLDEPTNYLDIAAIRWVERFLSAWPRELLLITHDRSFMDRVVTHVLGIHRQKIRKVAGDTGKYYDQIAQEEEIHEKTRLNDERKRKQIEQFISRFRAKARLANLVQSRIKTIDKMERKEKLESLETLGFSFRSLPFAGKHVMSARGLGFSYDGKTPLIDGFNLSVGPGDRICVVGRNGRGKTTLLKLLAGVLKPRAGEVVYNPQVSAGFFEQTNIASLVDSRTVEEEILAAHPDVDRQTARNICGAMMFSGDDALKKVSVLSGGEKSRIMLGRLLATPVNLLLLDEPTNHLDMESCDALLSAVDRFDGAVIMVTHNEMFLYALAQRLVVFQGGGIQLFDGGYQRFLETEGWEGEQPEAAAKKEGGSAGENRPTRKEIKRRRSELIAERGRVLRPLQKRITAAEDRIEACEQGLERLNREMQEASELGDGTRIASLGQSIHGLQEDIDRLFVELEQVTTEKEARQDEYDHRLQAIERQQDG